MPEDRVGSGGGPQRQNLQSTGITSRDRKRARNNVKKPAFSDVSRNKTLVTSRLEWRRRAKGGANEDLDGLMVLSTAYRHGLDTEWSNKDITPEQVKENINKRSDLLLSTVKKSLPSGPLDKQDTFLFEAYKSAVLALKDYAHGPGTLDQAKARVRGFTNLKLFAAYGGDLHSRKGGDKLERTLAKIPEIVLKNASPDVTADDYSKADLQRHEGRWFQRRRALLSFSGFKATDSSWFGKDKHSRAYREDLRAVTASALLLGGVKKALKVKKLLTLINDKPAFEDSGTKEEIVKTALKNLETHGDLDALIDELAYKAERRELLRAQWLFCLDRYNDDKAEEIFSDFHKQILELDKSPNRATILRNFVDDINDPNSGYDLSDPYKNIDFLKYMSKEIPVRSAHKSKTEKKAKAARKVIEDWIDRKVPQGSPERQNLKRAIEEINKISFSNRRDRVFLHAVKSSIEIDSSKMSAREQAVLLLSCLQRPYAPASVHLAEVDSLKADGNTAQEVKRDINQDDPVVNIDGLFLKDLQPLVDNEDDDSDVNDEIGSDIEESPKPQRSVDEEPDWVKFLKKEEN